MKPQNGLFLLLLLAFVALLASCQNRHNLRYPFGAADFGAVALADTLELPISNSVTYLSGALTDDAVVSVTTSIGLPPGSLLYVRATADENDAYTIEWASGFTAANTAVDTSESKIVQFVFDGSGFVHLSTATLE